MTYTITNPAIYNGLSIVDGMGRTKAQRVQRFIDAAEGARSATELANVLASASARMGVTLSS